MNLKNPDEIKKGLECCINLTGLMCPYCPYAEDGDMGEMCREDMSADALALIQQLEAQVPRWISVEERLPKTQVDVLLFVKHEIGGTNFVAVGSRAHWTPNRYYIGAVTTAIDADRVTHWMPLPEPPKEENNNGKE